MNCRFCGSELEHTFIDLGYAPPANAYLTKADLSAPEHYYPLKTKVCGNCWLVQTEDYARPEELFKPDYAYFSSTSCSWLSHAQHYAQKIVSLLKLTTDSFVIEVGSNDGYMLKHFVAAGIPCLGIEPTADTAAAAADQGIDVVQEFFGETLAEELIIQGKQADLIIGNNVYAHVPDIVDFTRGIKTALKPHGVVTLEFPHIMELIRFTQFDTIYHEHFSYLSLFTVTQIFREANLRIWDVERLQTHGGSLRVFGCHIDDSRENHTSVNQVLKEEQEFGLKDLRTYAKAQSRAEKIKDELLSFLLEQKNLGKKVAAYGAAAKGNTILNFAGVKPDLLPFVCDAATSKQGKYMPGSHIPIYSPEWIGQEEIDFLLILPWNIREEVQLQNAVLEEKGVQFVTAVPSLTIK